MGVQIRDLGEKRYLFKFYHSMDMERVLKGLYWTFNNHLLILNNLKRGEDPLKIPLVHVPFWVQIHEVPLGLFSRSLAMLLGNFIGVFLEYDASNLRKENRNFMRVRVQIDVRKPIRRKKQVMSNGVCSYVKFKYEKLSLFCFFCGRLGHNDSYCETKMTLGSNPIEIGWDLSLRAPSRRALSMNSIWLREEDEGGKGGGWMENRFKEMSSRNGISKDNKRNSLDPILGFNLEGRGTTMEKPKENSWLYKKYTLMDHYLEDEVLMGEEGKKRNRGEMEGQILLSSTATKRLTDRSQ